ncbi:nuclear transport factor 2 family protein [Psychrosphaera aestuarii]|uniref:nuclear transport factor 2 family protein n=1 Tax=Psychrosphaera aestuarii TaxID=1266052 RepID=UPI001B3388CE|nr:nuclear transport factor 2 family protein [Psychrosphaera aestuarii]
MKHLIFIMIFVIFSGTCDANENQNSNELTNIKEVIATFEQSIINKDKDTFLSLFIDPEAPMYGIVSPKTMVLRRAGVAEINKRDNKNFVATRYWTTSAKKLIAMSSNNKGPVEERISNVKIQTDGNIASVFFDYEFYKNNKKVHWGQENMQMIQTNQGWKIASVVYSFTSEQ